MTDLFFQTQHTNNHYSLGYKRLLKCYESF